MNSANFARIAFSEVPHGPCPLAAGGGLGHGPVQSTWSEPPLVLVPHPPPDGAFIVFRNPQRGAGRDFFVNVTAGRAVYKRAGTRISF
jgi:hypothetical protein